MITKLTISALALVAAVPAFAAATQAERSVGVGADAYTLSQIAAIAGAEKPNEAARLKAFYANAGGDVSRADFSAPAAPVAGRGNQGSDR